jgi:hypothetical protein
VVMAGILSHADAASPARVRCSAGTRAASVGL